MAYKLSAIGRGASGVCPKCGQPTNDMFTLKLSDDNGSKQLQLCPSCSKKLYESVQRRNEQEKQRVAVKEAETPVTFATHQRQSDITAPAVDYSGGNSSYTDTSYNNYSNNNQYRNYGEKFCPNCGSRVRPDAVVCVNCGSAIRNEVYDPNVSDKDWVVTLLLYFFLGVLGGHRFYVGKIGTGILYIFTAGLFGIGCLVDLIMILTGKFTDSKGKVIKHKK